METTMTKETNTPWTDHEAIKYIAKIVEPAAKTQKLHTALGGSVLYDGRSDNDLDVIVYTRVAAGPMTPARINAFVKHLRANPEAGVINTERCTWCGADAPGRSKAADYRRLVYILRLHDGRRVDLVFVDDVAPLGLT
jgi:predicted ATPase